MVVPDHVVRIPAGDDWDSELVDELQELLVRAADAHPAASEHDRALRRTQALDDLGRRGRDVGLLPRLVELGRIETGVERLRIDLRRLHV